MSLQLFATTVAVVAGVVGIFAGIFAIRRHLKPDLPPRILNPHDQAEVGSRSVTLTGVVPRPHRNCAYWIAIQPADASRAANYWWPQRQRLTLQSDGAWTLPGATLGRAGDVGEQRDVGKMYTIGIFEVPPSAQPKFQTLCDEGERLTIPPECRLLHSVDVRRVSYSAKGRGAG
jgi:hypothetical protein